MSLRHNALTRARAWVRSNLWLVVVAGLTLCLVVLVFITTFRLYDSRRAQAIALCQVARANRADNNAQNDAMRNILIAAARTNNSDPARLELLLSQIPANRPVVECTPTLPPPTTSIPPG